MPLTEDGRLYTRIPYDGSDPPPEGTDRRQDARVTRQWCEAWIFRHMFKLMMDTDIELVDKEHREERVKVWAKRLEYINKHGPSTLRDLKKAIGEDVDVA